MTGITLHYNESCPDCARQAARTARLDWFGRVALSTEHSPLGGCVRGVMRAGPASSPIAEPEPPPTQRKSSVREWDRRPLGEHPGGTPPLRGSAAPWSHTNLLLRRTPAGPGRRLNSRSRSITTRISLVSSVLSPECLRIALPRSGGQVIAHPARDGHGSGLRGCRYCRWLRASGQRPSCPQLAYRISDLGHRPGFPRLGKMGQVVS